ncbi:hypothetical protein GQ600_9251 [Phytophthora cactorum]|nr:hypothetical protein GQ600_9251 [Phytophthora cactorum]
MSSTPADNANAARAPQRLTWRRKSGSTDERRPRVLLGRRGALGGAVLAAVTALGPFPDARNSSPLLEGLIGAGAGYLYADTKALERVHDLSASSNLRKQYQQM